MGAELPLSGWLWSTEHLTNSSVSQCDGEKPAFCTRCQTRGLRCVYKPHTKTHKTDLLREIEAMRVEHADLQDEHLELQESTRDLEKMHQDQSVILHILTNNGHVEEVISRLRGGESQDSVARWLQGRPELKRFIGSISGSEGSLIAVVGRVEKMYNSFDPANELYTPRQRTRVTASPVLIHHLFELYFTWVHPVHMLFGEVDFLKSYHSGDEVYCSDALVNAVCAMACHLLDSPAPGMISRDTSDRMDMRDGFMAEARALLKPGREFPMASLQAFAVMYLAELSAGRARNASAYLRCAADNLSLPPDSSQHEEESLQLSAWGIHTLNTSVVILKNIPSHVMLTLAVLGLASPTKSLSTLYRQEQQYSSTCRWTKTLHRPNGDTIDS